MDKNTKAFWINLRASFLQEAKAYQDARAAKLALAADIERMLKNADAPPNKTDPAQPPEKV